MVERFRLRAKKPTDAPNRRQRKRDGACCSRWRRRSIRRLRGPRWRSTLKSGCDWHSTRRHAPRSTARRAATSSIRVVAHRRLDWHIPPRPARRRRTRMEGMGLRPDQGSWGREPRRAGLRDGLLAGGIVRTTSRPRRAPEANADRLFSLRAAVGGGPRADRGEPPERPGRSRRRGLRPSGAGQLA
jgi:hypothetical protein